MLLAGVLLALHLAAPPPEIVLRGCVLTQDPQGAVAVLASAGSTRVVTVGESAFGGRVVSISAEGATLDFEGRRVTVRLPSAAPAETSTKPRITEAETTVDPETPPRNMARADVDRRLAIEMNRILTETALAPLNEDGKVTGVSLAKIAQGSLLTDVGLRQGDVITEINGTRIDSLATLMGLYAGRKGEKELRAIVLRGGKPVSLRINLQ
jgi:type II secretion system protein C